MHTNYETLVRIAETTIEERRRRAALEHRIDAEHARPVRSGPRARLARLLRLLPGRTGRRATRPSSTPPSCCEACA